MNRPRCCEWLPLYTQQLRLRNVLRIIGVNIACVEKCALVYYTLHHTKEENAIYISETLPQQQTQLKWAEITCAEMLKSNLNCVCVKVWSRSTRMPTTATTILSHSHNNNNNNNSSIHCHTKNDEEPQSALSSRTTTTETPAITKASLNSNNVQLLQDQLLFTWGVYFSGLIVLPQLVDTKCSANSLIFQINDKLFASPDHLSVDHLREQLSYKYERLSESVPRTGSMPAPQPHPDANDDTHPHANSINSPRGSRSTSPVTQDLLRMSKTRYMQLNCPTKDVRPSYSLEQLLRIQELQRKHLQRVRDSCDMSNDIRQLSVHCVTNEELERRHHRRRRTTSNQQYHSMGRALSVLLADEQHAEPSQLLHAQRLQREAETLRARKRLLQAERAAYAERIERMRQHMNAFTEQSASIKQQLHEQRERLCDEQQQLQEQKNELDNMRQAKRRLILNMERRMAVLCLEMREIYPVGHDDEHHLHTVCGIPFPSIAMYAGSDVNSQMGTSNSANYENVTAIALSVSLGYVAHLVQMLSVILNRPLRNPIVHEGSHSRIMDVIKDIQYVSREYPLYSRSSILPKPVKYAIYLLNQNINQLCYDITGHRCNSWATIENINRIFLILEELEQHQREFGESMVNFRVEKVNGGHGNSGGVVNFHDAVDGGSSYDQPSNLTAVHCTRISVSADDAAIGLSMDNQNIEILSKSNSSDMNHALSPPTVLALAKANKKLFRIESLTVAQTRCQHRELQQHGRISRSVGSYSDCDEDEFKVDTINKYSYSNSDSRLNVQRGDGD